MLLIRRPDPQRDSLSAACLICAVLLRARELPFHSPSTPPLL
jgi:hypothetical protein